MLKYKNLSLLLYFKSPEVSTRQGRKEKRRGGGERKKKGGTGQVTIPSKRHSALIAICFWAASTRGGGEGGKRGEEDERDRLSILPSQNLRFGKRKGRERKGKGEVLYLSQPPTLIDYKNRYINNGHHPGT